MSNIIRTGGAGFIGCNYAAKTLTAGNSVTVFDSLSHSGAAANLAWLQQNFEDALDFVPGDVRDAEAVAADGKS